MAQPRKKTAAAKRRRIGNAIVAAERASILTGGVYVEPSISVVTDNVKRILARELEFMRETQDAGESVGVTGAKALQSLMSAVATAQQVEKTATEEDFGGMTNEEVEQALMAELEKVRALKV